MPTRAPGPARPDGASGSTLDPPDVRPTSPPTGPPTAAGLGSVDPVAVDGSRPAALGPASSGAPQPAGGPVHTPDSPPAAPRPDGLGFAAKRRLAALGVAVLGLLVAAAAAVAQVLVSRTIPVPSGLAEATVGANAYGLARLDGFSIPDTLSGRLLGVHVGLYDELAAAAERHASVAGSVREFLVVVAAISALALFTLCRQLGLSAAASTVAALLAGLAPALVSAQILTFAALVALMWLLVAGAVIAARPTAPSLTWLGRLVSTALVALSTLLAPMILLLPAGILVCALLSGALFPRWRLGGRIALTAVVTAVVAAVALLAPDVLRSGPDSAIPPATAAAIAAVGLLLAAVGAWRVLWLRPVALGCVPVLVVAVLPIAGAPTALISAIPVVAVLLVAFAEDSLAGPRRRSGTLVWRGLAAAMAALTVVGLVVLPSSAAEVEEGTPPLALAEWIGSNLDPGTVVQVSPLLWVELVRAGVPEEQLQRTTDPASDGPIPRLLAERGGAHADYPLVAEFGAGPLAIGVRERVPDVDRAAGAREAEQAASATFGSALRDNPNVVLRGTAGPDLGSGLVDSRLLTVLASAAADFTYTVEGFPRLNGPADVGTLRTVRLTGIQPLDGLDEDSAGVRLRDYFRYQLVDYRPLRQGFSDGVLVVTYSAPSPVGLLS